MRLIKFMIRFHVNVLFGYFFLDYVSFGSIPIGASLISSSSWNGSRIGDLVHLLSCVIDGGEVKTIINDFKLM